MLAVAIGVALPAAADGAPTVALTITANGDGTLRISMDAVSPDPVYAWGIDAYDTLTGKGYGIRYGMGGPGVHEVRQGFTWDGRINGTALRVPPGNYVITAVVADWNNPPDRGSDTEGPVWVQPNVTGQTRA